MNKSKKIRLIIITAIVLGLLGYVAYMCLNYFFYNEYRKYLTRYSVMEGKEYSGLEDADPKGEGSV